MPVPLVFRDAVFPWLKTAQDNFNADTSRNSTCATDRCFLLFLSNLAEVVVQDAAALAVQFPNRISHPIYQLSIFGRDDFKEYMEEMKIHLEQSKSPWDNSFEQFNQGLNAKLSGIQSNLSGCRSIHERNSSMLTQISAQSNMAVFRETIIKLLSKPCKTVADNPIKSRNTDTYIAHLCQLSHSLNRLRRD